eukprot:2730520-Ditylum_brightwellii.AAC.1
MFLLCVGELDNLFEIGHDVADFCLDGVNVGAAVHGSSNQDLLQQVAIYVNNSLYLWRVHNHPLLGLNIGYH